MVLLHLVAKTSHAMASSCTPLHQRAVVCVVVAVVVPVEVAEEVPVDVPEVVAVDVRVVVLHEPQRPLQSSVMLNATDRNSTIWPHCDTLASAQSGGSGLPVHPIVVVVAVVVMLEVPVEVSEVVPVEVREDVADEVSVEVRVEV